MDQEFGRGTLRIEAEEFGGQLKRGQLKPRADINIYSPAWERAGRGFGEDYAGMIAWIIIDPPQIRVAASEVSDTLIAASLTDAINMAVEIVREALRNGE